MMGFMNENYRAYLIRFQRRGAGKNWSVMLKDVHTQETLNFSTAKELLGFILQSLNDSSEYLGQDVAPPKKIE